MRGSTSTLYPHNKGQRLRAHIHVGTGLLLVYTAPTDATEKLTGLNKTSDELFSAEVAVSKEDDK